MPKQDFIHSVTEGLLAPPAYFFDDARINKQGYDTIGSVIIKNKKALDISTFQKVVSEGALILDTRKPDHFETGFIAGSVNIGLEGMFAIWVGTLLDIGRTIVLVCDPGKEEECVIRLARVGFEKVAGYLSGGIDAWKKTGLLLETIKTVSPSDFASKVKDGAHVLDVRKISEAENGHVSSATVIPLSDLEKNQTGLDKSETLYVHCAGGYRSMIASSILQANGFKNIINVHDGWNKIKDTGVPIATGIPENLVTG
jgi:rhodanese-related sulfurtransferase